MRNSLCELRTGRGWSQQHLADALGVSRQTVISIEKGRFDPSLPLAFRIASTFACRIEDVFYPEDDSTSSDTTRSASGSRP